VWAVVAYPPGYGLTVEAIPVFVGYQDLHLAGFSWLVQTTTLLVVDVTPTDHPGASRILTIFA